MAITASPGSNAALITAFMTPTTNWGAVMAGKDRQLQQQQYASAQAEQDVVEQQQAAARISQFQQTLKSLPFEAPDQRRLKGFLTKQESDIAKRIATEYKGDRGAFWKTEGSDWMQHTLNDLQGSSVYQDAEHNREQLASIKEAVKKGDTLIGDVVTKNGKQAYVPFMESLNDYHAGKLPRITFNGSYKPDDDLIKHFGSEYAPNAEPWAETAVSEDHKLNYLLTANKTDVGMDKYFQQYAGKSVFWKRDSLVDKAKFDMQRGTYNMAVGRDGRDRAMFGVRKEGAELSNALKRQKLAGDTAEGGGDYISYLVNNGLRDEHGKIEGEGSKVLPHSGYDLKNLAGKDGTVQMYATPLYSQGALNILAAKVGLGTFNKKDGEYAGSDHIKEGFVVKNGVHPINLSNSQFSVVSLDRKLFHNITDAETSRTGPNGFARVQIQFKTDRDAHEAGLYNINGFDSVRKSGMNGVYDPSTRRAWITTNIGSLSQDRMFGSALQKDAMGQKEANKAINTGIGLGGDDEDY